MEECVYPAPPLWSEYDTKSIFKLGTAGFSSKFSFS